MKSKLATLLVALLALAGITLIGAPAYAGSDSPTPYSVTTDGIQLPGGATFQDNGHVNIKTTQGNFGIHFEGKCVTRTDAECAGERHDVAQYIGKSFLPWKAFAWKGLKVKKPFCVSWVQLSQYNEHFGEGGQSPVGTGCSTPTPEPTPNPTPTPDPLPEDKVTITYSKPLVNCATKVGDVVEVEKTTVTVRYSYDPYGKVVSTSSTYTEKVPYTIVEPDLFDLVCPPEPTATPEPTPTQPPLPETGGEVNYLPVLLLGGSGLLGGVVLLAASAARRRRQVS